MSYYPAETYYAMSYDPAETYWAGKGRFSKEEKILSEVIDEKDLQLDRLSKMALDDPSTGGNPKKLTEADMKVMYQHSMSGTLF